jgi:hypothetical protein
MSDLANLSDEELDALSHELMATKDKIRARQLEVNAERDRRELEQFATTVLGSLTPGQKDALIQGARAEANARAEG